MLEDEVEISFLTLYSGANANSFKLDNPLTFGVGANGPVRSLRNLEHEYPDGFLIAGAMQNLKEDYLLLELVCPKDVLGLRVPMLTRVNLGYKQEHPTIFYVLDNEVQCTQAPV
jgi:hypothetical protein